MGRATSNPKPTSSLTREPFPHPSHLLPLYHMNYAPKPLQGHHSRLIPPTGGTGGEVRSLHPRCGNPHIRCLGRHRARFVNEVEFTGQNLENSIDLADHRHPMAHLEPEEEPQASGGAEMLGKVMVEVFRGRGRSKLDYAAAFNRFIALVWVIRPDLLDGKSLMILADEVGITRAALSKNATAFSDLLGGYRNGAQKSQAARESYREVQMGHESYRRPGTPINPRTQQRLEQLRDDFHQGKAWRQIDKDLLRRRGLIGAGDRLTAAGKAWLRGTKENATPPPLRNLFQPSTEGGCSPSR